ncbi:glycosyltransferase family 4 protein [Paraburkholderia sp. J67]|uniref:glycosyltransferase family 4 protein n=1 Tax=Paraburkholderia sp. J67 TaxID=2805435 RepID=UPI002ABD3069|nr:glycosyltransferase family 4 protein [Paraburkholderia sp. J67]
MNGRPFTRQFPSVETVPAIAADALVDDTGKPSRRRPPSALFVDQSGQPGGAELCLLPLAALHAAHSEVLLLSDGPFRELLEAQGVRVIVKSNAQVSAIKRAGMRLSWLRALPGMYRQILAIATRARYFDVLFLNTQKALVLGALGKPLHRSPIVWHAHDVMTRDHFGKMQLRIVRWLVRHAIDQVVANSQATADALIELTGLPASAIPVVHNGIDVDAFMHADPVEAQSLRRRFNLPENAWLAGLFGRLAPWKGQHVAIESLTRLQDVHLALVGGALFGEDDYVKELHCLAARLGVADRVHFVGTRNDVPVLMKAMDVILHTSLKPEPFGRVIIEGMAAGRPVVASGAGGVTEIVQHRMNGWLIEPGNVAALADAIETLRATPNLVQCMTDRAVHDVQQHFALDAYLQQVTHIIARARR